MKFKEYLIEKSIANARYKVGQNITFFNIHTKRKRTRKIIEVFLKHGQIAYGVDGGAIVFESDIET